MALIRPISGGMSLTDYTGFERGTLTGTSTDPTHSYMVISTPSKAKYILSTSYLAGTPGSTDGFWTSLYDVATRTVVYSGYFGGSYQDASKVVGAGSVYISDVTDNSFKYTNSLPYDSTCNLVYYWC